MSSRDVTRQRARRADARLNSERLLVTARDAFAEHGPDASLIEIARRAGVSSGTLYRHFPTRSALLAAVYRSEIEALGQLATQLRAEPDSRQALASWLGAFSEYTTTCRGLKGLVATLDVAEDASIATWWQSTLLPAATELVERAQRAGTIRADVATVQVLRLVNGVALAQELTGFDSAEIRPLLRIILDGLAAPAAVKETDVDTEAG